MEWVVGWEPLVRLAVAAVLGAVIGFDREVQDHPAGLRTHATVALGAALFGVVSTLGFDEVVTRRELTNVQVDVTRVASQVVVGVGFLGAGLIFRRGGAVRNLTTAASVWATAAVGLAAGVGNLGVAVAGASLMLVVLALAPYPQRWIVQRFGRDRRHVQITLADGTSPDEVRTQVGALAGVDVTTWRLEKHDGRLVVDAHLAAHSSVPLDQRIDGLTASPAVTDLRVVL